MTTSLIDALVRDTKGTGIDAREAGRAAYEGFAKAIPDEAPPGPWEKLPLHVRRAWQRAAVAAVRSLRIGASVPKERGASAGRGRPGGARERGGIKGGGAPGGAGPAGGAPVKGENKRRKRSGFFLPHVSIYDSG